ncbi:hypothetical protein [Nostoc sp. CHAB 5715]|uniref:hypothetical protein n=1 Tax=Nostoc sp. CHAB 5715 TaxID=2780400 RepID=UPI001E410C6B|nr:hypothetical protein [Nostoc sp. CHAB 5715]MCC5620480.1 hypothetical protein [Nostoc sp. CHAB 5715]
MNCTVRSHDSAYHFAEGVAYLRDDFASFVGWGDLPVPCISGRARRPPYKNHPLIQQRLCRKLHIGFFHVCNISVLNPTYA